MNFRKIVAAFAAVSTILTSLPFTASAGRLGSDALFYDDDAYCSYIIYDGRAIITEVFTDGTYFDIPDKIDYEFNGEKYSAPVTGVQDYAFALCENLTNVYVPETFKIEDTGNVAFLTSSAVMDFLNKEVGPAATMKDVIKYVADVANYKDGNYTDKDLAELAIKLENKIGDIDISKAETLEGKIMIILTNVENLELNPQLRDSFKIWSSCITYNNFTLSSFESAQEVVQYAKGREILGMKFSPISPITDYVLGDSNGDNKFNVRDAAYIASCVAKGIKIDLMQNPGADYNQDGTVNVRDAAHIARDLSKK